MVLSDVYNGRNLPGVKRGEIKKLLLLESLPSPSTSVAARISSPGWEPSRSSACSALSRSRRTVRLTLNFPPTAKCSLSLWMSTTSRSNGCKVGAVCVRVRSLVVSAATSTAPGRRRTSPPVCSLCSVPPAAFNPLLGCRRCWILPATSSPSSTGFVSPATTTKNTLAI